METEETVQETPKSKKADHPCFTKKRLYKLFVKQQIEAGKANLPDGSWVSKK